jgi:protocatechuate 3,4-dioxygenase beta subunit
VKIGQTLAVIGVLASLGCWRLAAQERLGNGVRRFTLSGTVVDGASSQPLAGVEVSLQTQKWKAAGNPATTDAQGRFAFAGLAAGEYILTAEGSFGTVLYGEAPDPGGVSTVRVGGESGDKAVVFRILARGGIEGTVRDEFSDPMMRATVQISRPQWRDGRATLASVGEKSTDDRGRYRFGNLAPGTYIVCAGGGQNASAPLSGTVDFATRTDNRAYAHTCSRAFQISPGQHAQVDLSPTTTTTATVRGKVRNLPPSTGFSVNLGVDEGGDSFVLPFNAFVDVTQGTFTIRGVPPGHYHLLTNVYTNTPPASGPLSAEFPLEVGGSDIDGLDVAVDSQGSVDVTFLGDSSGTGASLRSVTSTTRAERGAVRNKDGSFHFAGVSPGRYWLDARTSEDVCVQSVKLGDRDIRGAPFELAAGAALHFEVALSNRCGGIRIRATRDDAAVPGAKVVLLLSGTPKEPGNMMQDFANDEGEVTFSGLAPGRYLLWAWAVQGTGAITGPASLAAVEAQATAVDVTAGNPVRADVPLLADEGKGQ